MIRTSKSFSCLQSCFHSHESVLLIWSYFYSSPDSSGYFLICLNLLRFYIVWSEKLRKGLDRRDKYIFARDSKYCLVVEAWGFSGKQTGYYISPLIPVVGCWSCVKYGRKFGFVAKKHDCTDVDFEPIISEFLAHWNQKHKSITKGIKH